MANTPDPNGNADSVFVARVRRMIRDQPVVFPDGPQSDGTTGTLAAGSKPFRTQRAPIISGSLAISAPSGANMTGFTTWSPRYNNIFTPPLPVPVVSDGGAAGTFAAGTYGILYTLVDSSGNESPPSFLSNSQAIIVNHKLTVAALSGLPSNAATINYWLAYSIAAGSSVGFLGSQVVAAGVAAIITFTNPPATQVGTVPMFVNLDTGEIIFPNGSAGTLAPVSGTVNLTYQAARFSDQEIVDSLYEGLYLLFPEIWQPQFDTSLAFSPTTTEYTLPAVFNDPDVNIIKMEIQPPSGLLISLETGLWRRAGLTTLVFRRMWPSGSIIRLTYNAPYLLLSDLEVELMDAPCYYAAARLMADMETARGRQSDLVALTGEGGSATGTGTTIADYWIKLFSGVKSQRARPQVYRQQVEDRSVELLESQREFDWNPV